LVYIRRMCRFFIEFHHTNVEKIIMDFLGQSIQKNKNTPGIDNYRDHVGHADGYGISWFVNGKWNIYKSTEIYKNDPKLPLIIRKIPKNVVVGHIRKKKYGKKSIVNVHPFTFENQIFMQNGYINDFTKHISKIKEEIFPEYLQHIVGGTDTECLFFLYLTCKRRTENNVDAFAQMFSLFKQWNIELVANIVYANDTDIVITRYLYYDQTDYKDKQSPPSLYWNISSSNGILITSEPVLDATTLIQENTIISLNHRNGKMDEYRI
jgi:predicted glutamine amidotransferase